MKKFLSLSDNDRRNVFVKQKVTIGLPEVSIEKDLWVTQVLHEMFSIEGHGLHAERKSRHLYDLYKMMSRPFAEEAIKDDALWESIRHHREIYTSVNGMDYTPDVRERLVLVPREEIMDAWKTDYEQMMSNMIYGEKPTWAELMVAMKKLQERVRIH